MGHCATCQGSSYTKSECNLFYPKFEAEYFFIQQFFSKKAVFSDKTEKTVLGAHLTERRRLTPKINITFLSQMRYRIFYYLPIFSKNE